MAFDRHVVPLGSRLVMACTLLAGCTSSHAPHASDTIDAAVPQDAARSRDAWMPDGCVSDGQETFFDRGYCFTVDRCCVSADCADDEVCSPRGRCTLAVPRCSCASDGDCSWEDECFTNETVCGACMPLRPTCDGSPCDAGLECVDGYCVDPSRACITIRRW